MQKHLLITVSDDPSCLYGIRFVGSFFTNKSAIKLTLLYVAPTPEIGERDRSRVQHELNEKAKEMYRKRGEEALSTSQRLLARRGFCDEHITCKFMFKKFGTVRDIIREGHKGKYDAVVLGRRGYTLFESFLSSSVSKAIMDQEIDFPIWICRHPEEHRKNVLLCVDGSEPSLRMADHVGFILKDETEHSVTIFHVDTGEVDVQLTLGQARAMLVANGLPEERINTEVVRSSNIAKTIMDEAERRSYAVVAVGRVGVQKGALKGWFVGSRSMKLLENLERAALWVSK